MLICKCLRRFPKISRENVEKSCDPDGHFSAAFAYGVFSLEMKMQPTSSTIEKGAWQLLSKTILNTGISPHINHYYMDNKFDSHGSFSNYCLFVFQANQFENKIDIDELKCNLNLSENCTHSENSENCTLFSLIYLLLLSSRIGKRIFRTRCRVTDYSTISSYKCDFKYLIEKSP